MPAHISNAFDTNISANISWTMSIYLDDENLSTGGQVEYLDCNNCQISPDSFPYSTFVLRLNADHDSMYTGVVGLTSCKQNEIIITRLTREEYKNYGKYSMALVTERLNKFLNRDDLEFKNMAPFTDNNGNKFLDYACVHCGDRLTSTKRKNLERFISDGGRIITIGIFEQ